MQNLLGLAQRPHTSKQASKQTNKQTNLQASKQLAHDASRKQRRWQVEKREFCFTPRPRAAGSITDEEEEEEEEEARQPRLARDAGPVLQSRPNRRGSEPLH